MSDKPIVFIAPEAFWQKPASFVDNLKSAGFEIRYPSYATFTRGPKPEETVNELAGCAAIIAGGEFFTPEILDELPDLKVIARCGVGFDRVDVDAATERGIAVTITPTSNHTAVAEHTFALVLSVAKSIVKNDRALRSGHFSQVLTKPIRGQTIGLIGLGRIGRSTALLGRALGMNVSAFELYPDEQFVCDHNIKLCELDELLAQADFVSMHCPLNDETRGMCNADFFSKMKAGANFINTSRGGLVVESDLIEAIKSGHIAGAGLDVYEVEPTPENHPLFELEQVSLSPHVAGTDEASMLAMLCEAADCIIKILAGEWPEVALVNKSLMTANS